MVLFLLLTTVLLILLVVTFVAVSVFGAAGIIVFGDVIVCIAIIVWIIKLLHKRRKK